MPTDWSEFGDFEAEVSDQLKDVEDDSTFCKIEIKHYPKSESCLLNWLGTSIDKVKKREEEHKRKKSVWLNKLRAKRLNSYIRALERRSNERSRMREEDNDVVNIVKNGVNMSVLTFKLA